MAYEKTEVAVESSQAAIRKLLYEHGARNFAFSETEVESVSWAGVDFVHDEQRVRMRVPIRQVDQKVFQDKVRRAQTRTPEQIGKELVEQEAKRIWRVMFHGLKARLVSVEEGVETFEEAFLSHLVDPVSGMTLWEAMKGAVESGALKIGGVGVMGRSMLELAQGGGGGEVGREVGGAGDGDRDGLHDGDVVEAEIVG